MTTRENEYRSLLCGTLIVVALGIGAVLICYFWISLGDVFGRYWPQTWTHDHPSLIGTGTYGFHPFQRGDDIGSFPSGHACRILGFAAVWMIAMPRSRTVQIAVIVLCAPMLLSLVAMNYHFVSDVIACGVLGAIIATYAAHLARLPALNRDVA